MASWERALDIVHRYQEHIRYQMFVLADHKHGERHVDAHDLADDICCLGGNVDRQTDL